MRSETVQAIRDIRGIRGSFASGIHLRPTRPPLHLDDSKFGRRHAFESIQDLAF